MDKKKKRFLVIFTALFSCLFLFACNKQSNIVSPLDGNTVIIEYSGGKILAKDVESEVKGQFAKLNTQAIELYKQAANQALIKALLDQEAKKEGTTAEDLVRQKIQSISVDESMVQKFMEDNAETIKAQKVTKEQVENYLKTQQAQSAQAEFFANLRKNANVKNKLLPPRIKINHDSSPFLGGENAKVVITEFSDFQCPYCANAAKVVKQLHEHYKDQIKIIYRNFPLNFHDQAQSAAIAAECANKQNQHWPMHDKIFDNQRNLSQENYLAWAKELNLDMVAFESCLTKQETLAEVEQDIKEATRIGVNSTPTFYINGLPLQGAGSLASFQEIIDSELAL